MDEQTRMKQDRYIAIALAGEMFGSSGLYAPYEDVRNTDLPQAIEFCNIVIDAISDNRNALCVIPALMLHNGMIGRMVALVSNAEDGCGNLTMGLIKPNGRIRWMNHKAEKFVRDIRHSHRILHDMLN